MNSIIKRPYRCLCDFERIYDFMVRQYSIDCRNGCMPPYFEYAQQMHWSEKTQNHRFAIWEDNGSVVAFCWYESSIGEAFFNYASGYECLIPEMISHAEYRLADDGGNLQLQAYGSQTALLDEAAKQGYVVTNRYNEGILDLTKHQIYVRLPDGYVFEKPGAYDMSKMIEATWRGFDNIGEPKGGTERGYHLQAAPNATPELDVVIKTVDGEYVCYAGMWWVPQNKLAYLEPFCTVPEHRGKGLGKAALAEMVRRVKALGATHMTGGDNPFYFGIGYEPLVTRVVLEKK